jgi:hypothetical protein
MKPGFLCFGKIFAGIPQKPRDIDWFVLFNPLGDRRERIHVQSGFLKRNVGSVPYSSVIITEREESSFASTSPKATRDIEASRSATC